MFAKLVVLILVFGASGIGVLSVRQSRLQAVHEIAEARHRIRRLDEQAGEIRSMIVTACTPQRVHALLEDREGFTPASAAPAQIELARRVIEQPAPETLGRGVTREDAPDGSVIFTLKDGTRVVFVRDEADN